MFLKIFRPVNLSQKEYYEKRLALCPILKHLLIVTKKLYLQNFS